MESYLELTFIHNILIHSLSLTLSNLYSRKKCSRKLFITIVLCSTCLQSFLFIPYSSTIIWINEILILYLFKYKTSTYIAYIGFRLLFIIFYYFMFHGTIYHNQFFLFDYQTLYFDLIILIFYISLLFKVKYILSENDFVYPFILNNKTYKGYMDSGNQATYQQKPIIFIKENIYNQSNKEIEIIEIETINGNHQIEVIQDEIIINSNKKKVYISKIENDFKYDALLNMKGIL